MCPFFRVLSLRASLEGVLLMALSTLLEEKHSYIFPSQKLQNALSFLISIGQLSFNIGYPFILSGERSLTIFHSFWIEMFFVSDILLSIYQQFHYDTFSPSYKSNKSISKDSNFYTNFQVDKIGQVVSVGDGIARVIN